MRYVSNEQYNDIHNIRDFIDGELNRIAVTDDIQEIEKMSIFIQNHLKKYIQKNIDRVNGVYNSDI
jgi:hypothetical protein